MDTPDDKTAAAREEQAIDAPFATGSVGHAPPPLRDVLRRWRGVHEVTEGRQGKWQVGPLTLWLQHLPHEWRLAYESAGEENTGVRGISSVDTSEPIGKLPEHLTPRRFCFAHMCDAVKLSPQLPDRPVITKPEQPLYVYPGEQVTLYLSFPLWVRIEVGDPPRALQEVPVFRLSDTWFGANTREGELCYASRSFGRLAVRDINRRPYRALSAVVVRNRGQDPLFLERINTPCPLLSLYQDVDGQLWTNTQVFERTEGQQLASLEIDKKAPSEAKGAQYVSGPRQIEHRSVLVRAFSSFIS